MNSQLNIDQFDLRNLPRSFYDDPYPTYAALRAASPVRRLPDGSFFLSRYADLEHVYRDTATFSSDKSAGGPAGILVLRRQLGQPLEVGQPQACAFGGLLPLQCVAGEVAAGEGAAAPEPSAVRGLCVMGLRWTRGFEASIKWNRCWLRAGWTKIAPGRCTG